MMDNTSASTSPYGLQSHIFLRLWAIIENVSKDVLIYILNQSSKDKKSSESYLKYYERHGISKKKLKDRNVSHAQLIMLEEISAIDFDVSLLCSCFRNGFHGLATPDKKELWKDGSTSLESCITSIKNKRNTFTHSHQSYKHHQDLHDETTKVKSLLEVTLGLAQKCYMIPKNEIDNEIQKMHSNINKYLHGDLVPMTLNEYQALSVYPTYCNIVNNKGSAESRMKYAKELESVATVNHLFPGISLSLDEMYTEMKYIQQIGNQWRDENTTYEDILVSIDKNTHGILCGSVIVISGGAGVGKTTLTKKILNDWTKRKTNMRYLNYFDHLLKVECRNTAIKSFNELLHHALPNCAKEFPSDELLKYTICGQKVLIIIDGADEMNSSSALLFREILQIKDAFGITVLITTRPEKMKYVEELVTNLSMKIKNIRLAGIPMDKRIEFVSKYHDAIVNKYTDSTRKDKTRLCNYLKKTEYRLSSIWELPYNLALITILWVTDHTIIDRIHTESELYHEMLKLYKKKLSDRLQNCQLDITLFESRSQWVIEFFIFSLGRESLLGLYKDHINLPSEAISRLERICEDKNVPSEEMISAFLRKILGSSNIYGYSHKGIQEYLAATYIFRKITSRYQSSQSQDFLKEVEEALAKFSIPASNSENILSYCEDELKEQSLESQFCKEKTKLLVEKVLRDNNAPTNICKAIIAPFNRVNKGSTVKPDVRKYVYSIMEEVFGNRIPDLSKFTNTLQQLCGMFYLESSDIPVEIKREALELLEICGIKDKDEWIRALSNMNCDTYVAEFLSNRYKLLNNPIKINDENLFAYMSVMCAINPKDVSHGVMVHLELNGELPDEMEGLLNIIHKNRFQVRAVKITNNNAKKYKSLIGTFSSKMREKGNIQLDIDMEKDLTDLPEFYSSIATNSERFDLANITFDYHYKFSTGLGNLECVVAEMLREHSVFAYIGPMPVKATFIPFSISKLQISLPNRENLEALHKVIPQIKKVENVHVCISAEFDCVEDLQPLWKSDINMFLTDVRNENVDIASKILSRLQPVDDGFFYSISFPRCSLSRDKLQTLVKNMSDSGVKVTRGIHIPHEIRQGEPVETIYDIQIAREDSIWNGDNIGDDTVMDFIDELASF